MIVRSDIITRATVGAAVRGVPGVNFIDTGSREGWYEPIREFSPRAFANGFEFFLTGSSKYSAAHQGNSAAHLGVQGGYEKAATWDEWGRVIDALYDVDPAAQIGHYSDRQDFIEKTQAEAERIRAAFPAHHYQARTHRAPWLD